MTTTTDPKLEWTVREALKTRPAMAMLAVSAVIRAIYSLWAKLPYTDGFTYDNYAHHLVTEGTYRADFTQMPAKPPGYPFFLAAVYEVFGERHLPLYAVQHLVDLGTCVMVLAVARLYGLTKKGALVAFGLALFNPFTIVFGTLVMSETLATFLVTAALLLLLSIREGGTRIWLRFAGFGALMSYTALVRANLLPLTPLFLIGILALKRVRFVTWLKGGAVAAVAFVLLWAPWGIRNQARYHKFIPYYSGEESVGHMTPGYNRWAFTWVVSMLDVYAAFFDDPPAPPPKAYVSAEEREEVEKLIEERGSTFHPVAEPRYSAIDARFDVLAKERIAAQPFRYWIVNPTKRSLAMWFTRETTVLGQANVKMAGLRAAVTTQPLALAAKLALFVHMAGLPSLMVIGAIALVRRNNRLVLLPIGGGALLTIIVQYLTLMKPEFLVAAEPRYVIEVFPALTPAAALGALVLCGLPRAARDALRRRRVVAEAD